MIVVSIQYFSKKNDLKKNKLKALPPVQPTKLKPIPLPPAQLAKLKPMPLPTQLLHPRNRLPKITPAINLEQGRFFISRKEFDLRVNTIVKDLQKIIDFALFVRLKKKNSRKRFNIW